MPRVKITEYRAKRLIVGDAYRGLSLRAGESTHLPAGRQGLPKQGRFVVKVDQGVKKRMKQGLVAIDRPPRDIPKLIASWKRKGFTRFLAEPYLPHKESEEQYLSLERVRGGIRMLYARAGGIEIESHPELVKTFIVNGEGDIAAASRATKLQEPFLRNLIGTFNANFFAFLEINPLVVRGNTAHPLDAAVQVDSAGAFFVRGAWTEDDCVGAKAKHPSERAVAELAKTTPASLKLTVLHPQGSLFFLLSGGGGSIVIADQSAEHGAGSEIGNYGEYSGGPTREETHLYAREVLRLLLGSRAKKKALIIAGGVANFTDVKATFTGIIDALTERAAELRRAKVRVFVRRGGPNEAAGLAHMSEFLKKEKLFGSMHGSDAPITAAIDDALRYVRERRGKELRVKS